MVTRRGELYDRAEAGLSLNLVRDWPNVPIKSAKGCYAYGPHGEKYLDFCGGMAAASTGHCHDKVVSAIQKQAERLIHGPVGVLLYESIVQLAERLAKAMPEGLDSFFFLNSGSEAVEGAIKLARFVTQRPAIISMLGAFHGRTMGALSLTTSKAKYRENSHPLMGGVYHAPYPYCFRCPLGLTQETCKTKCLDYIEYMFERVISPSEVAAVIIEPVLGEGGYVPAPAVYLKGLREICSRHGILLIFDEIQTGFGRTGQMFAAHTFDVVPDIMAIAKGIASGMPLSAVATSQALMSKWTAGAHGTTFGGNPVCCAAALATLEVLRDEHLADNAAKLGPKILDSLRDMQSKYPVIGDVRGIGLMVGVEFVNPSDGKTPNPEAVTLFLRSCLEKGLILYPGGTHSQVVRFIPPLIVTDEEIHEALRIMDESFGIICQSLA